MTPEKLQAFLAAFDALPLGAFTGTAEGCKYMVSREDLAGGKSQKLVARELGGMDYISLNLYRLTSGARLKPCEMPAEKVVRFVLALQVME
ncbi:hypothetical protein [Leisingera sp. McT4-56]|uniref:hypothetical protein n=1 Tax=Leisingera sp. McT4-56 TaxID=2881255 RepID=UPI001CF87519|nr:hypothetical protein [Leisingera sp. McT4-56]MCB4454751.1 hypothetical protein [Leisingera sp. McT4-56]